MSWEIRQGDALEQLRGMPDQSVQCCVTSPPYYGLRDYGLPPTDWPAMRYSLPGGELNVPPMTSCLGFEETPEQFIGHMVLIFREVLRALREDGTAWVNFGDSYNTRQRGSDNGWEKSRLTNPARVQKAQRAALRPRPAVTSSKPKDLMGIPWLVAFALRADGWHLRRDVVEEVELYCPCGCGHVLEERIWRHSPDRDLVWSKTNPMPESVTDRPTTSHEYLFLLSKSPRYYYDAEAIREPDKGRDHPRSVLDGQPSLEPSNGVAPPHKGLRTPAGRDGLGRNKRSVWTIATAPYPNAHFATFPPDLVEPCILAGSPERACAECGAPWRRLVNSEFVPQGDVAASPALQRSADGLDASSGWGDTPRDTTRRTTIGFESTCDCDSETVPAVVLDPFAGAATTGLVATRLDRDFIGIELNPEYVELGRRRIFDDAPLLNSVSEVVQA